MFFLCMLLVGGSISSLLVFVGQDSYMFCNFKASYAQNFTCGSPVL